MEGDPVVWEGAVHGPWFPQSPPSGDQICLGKQQQSWVLGMVAGAQGLD